MDTMTRQMQTACHKCRSMATCRVEQEDGTLRVRQVPAAGDGEVVRVTMAVNGMTVISQQGCDLCNGTGWLPGFVPPG